jgi:hypothetical protein
MHQVSRPEPGTAADERGASRQLGPTAGATAGGATAWDLCRWCLSDCGFRSGVATLCAYWQPAGSSAVAAAERVHPGVQHSTATAQ